MFGPVSWKIASLHSLHISRACLDLLAPSSSKSQTIPSGNRLKWADKGLRELLSNSLVIFGFLLKFGGVLFVLFSDLVELLHVLKEIRTSLQGDEKLCLLAVTSLAVTSVV